MRVEDYPASLQKAIAMLRLSTGLFVAAVPLTVGTLYLLNGSRTGQYVGAVMVVIGIAAGFVALRHYVTILRRTR